MSSSSKTSRRAFAFVGIPAIYGIANKSIFIENKIIRKYFSHIFAVEIRETKETEKWKIKRHSRTSTDNFFNLHFAGWSHEMEICLLAEKLCKWNHDSTTFSFIVGIFFLLFLRFFFLVSAFRFGFLCARAPLRSHSAHAESSHTQDVRRKIKNANDEMWEPNKLGFQIGCTFKSPEQFV